MKDQSHSEKISALTGQNFKELGQDIIVYIRSVDEADAPSQYGVFAADGKLLSTHDDGVRAALFAKDNGFVPLSVH